MKKPIIFNVLFFIITATASLADNELGIFSELFNVVQDQESGLRTGKIEVSGEFDEFERAISVSYTHLTLPTKA